MPDLCVLIVLCHCNELPLTSSTTRVSLLSYDFDPLIVLCDIDQWSAYARQKRISNRAHIAVSVRHESTNDSKSGIDQTDRHDHIHSWPAGRGIRNSNPH